MKITYSRQSTIQVGDYEFGKIFFSAEADSSESSAEQLRDFVNAQHNIEYDRARRESIERDFKERTEIPVENKTQASAIKCACGEKKMGSIELSWVEKKDYRHFAKSKSVCEACGRVAYHPFKPTLQSNGNS